MTHAELMQAVDALRARGVKAYEDIAGGGFKVEFFAPQLPDEKPKAKVDEEKCACGHFHYEHTAGLCIKGCEPTSCSPEPTK